MEYTFILADAEVVTSEQITTTTTTTQAPSGEAKEQAESGGILSSPWTLPIILFVAMWFLLIAPQRKKEKIRKKMLAETKVGDNVITIGGICGTIVNKSEKTYILRVSDSGKLEVLIAAVNQNLTQEEALKADSKK